MVKLHALLLAFSLAMSSALALPVDRISVLSLRDLDQEFPRRELDHPLDARDTDDNLEARALKFNFRETVNKVKNVMRIGSKPQAQQNVNVVKHASNDNVIDIRRHSGSEPAPRRSHSIGGESGSEHHANNAAPLRSQSHRVYGLDNKHTGNVRFHHSSESVVHSAHGSSNGGSVHSNNVAKPEKTGRVMTIIKKVSQGFGKKK